MIEINVQNLNKNRRVFLEKAHKLALFVIKKISKQKNIILNLVFLTDSQIKKLNKEYKNKNIVTDVLCFCMFEGKKIKSVGNKCMSADIYISADTAFREAKAYNMTYTKELYFYVIHGILHMFGMRDDTEALRAKMHRKQHELLDEFIKKQRQKNKDKR